MEIAVDEGRKEIHWSPRVPKWKLRRLYERVAQGIWDEELIDDVGMTLYMRCRDILSIQRVQLERKVTCPRCEKLGKTALIARKGGRDELLSCSDCGWSIRWREYQRSFKRRQLNPGGAAGYFRAYIDAFANARNPTEKMLAIDRVIHEFHYSARNEPERPTRPAGVNLIVGDLEDVVVFLDALSGLNPPEPLRETHEAWRMKYDSTYWPEVLSNEQERKTDKR